MTAEQIRSLPEIDRGAAIQQKKALRKLLHGVFCEGEGRDALHYILLVCTFYERDTAKVDPSRIALAHQLLEDIGIFHAGNYHEGIDALAKTASNSDLEGGNER